MNVKKISIGIVGWIIKIVFIILIVMVVYKFSAQAYELGLQVFSDETMSEEPGQDYLVTVESGASALDVGKELFKQGLIKNEYVFYIQTLFYQKNNALVPGEYTVNTSMTAEEILSQITAESSEDEEE
jgi:cell division protein YceG involved in septum cleavage